MSDESQKAHVLQIVGRTGMKKAYLDVSPEEALRRYTSDNSGSNFDVSLDHVETIGFNDEFKLQNAWPSESDEDLKDSES